MTNLKSKFAILLLAIVFIIGMGINNVSNAKGSPIKLKSVSFSTNEVDVDTTQTINLNIDYTSSAQISDIKAYVTTGPDGISYVYEVSVLDGKIDVSNLQKGYTYYIDSITFYNESGEEIAWYGYNTDTRLWLAEICK